MLWQVLVQSGHIPMVYLECVSCKAQSVYEVSQNSYVFLRGNCINCQGFYRGVNTHTHTLPPTHKCVMRPAEGPAAACVTPPSAFQRWSATTLNNETLVLDSSSTTTGSHGMNLVLRQGVLRHKDSYNFTLHVTDGSLDGEGAASITLAPNLPPAGGECHLRAGGEAGGDHKVGDGDCFRISALLDRVHFNCSGRRKVPHSAGPGSFHRLTRRCFQVTATASRRCPCCTACWRRAAGTTTARTSACTKAAARSTRPSCPQGSAPLSTASPCPSPWRTTREPPSRPSTSKFDPCEASQQMDPWIWF